MKIAHIDCFSGASGDMLVAALLDAGLDFEALRSELAKLSLDSDEHGPPYELTVQEQVRHGLRGTKFDVVLPHPSAHHRHLPDIEHLISESTLSQEAKSRSLAVFRRLARAEAAVHGVPMEEVHFHEVGALDSIVDIVAFVAGLELLGVERLCSSPLTLGSGTVKAAHGTLPAPAPATLEILASTQVPTRQHPEAETELLTPTAAALLTELATFGAAPRHRYPSMTIERVGYGFGTRQLPWLNAVRIWLGEASLPTDDEQDEVVLVECNLDDVTGEELGHVLERCLQAGALDVWFTAIQMKKSRPGVKVSVLATPDLLPALSELLLRHTPTLGVRHTIWQRHKATRRIVSIDTPWGEVRLKEKILGGHVVARSPEYEDCARLAREADIPLAEVYRFAARSS